MTPSADLTSLLTLAPVGPQELRSIVPGAPGGRLFGGQVLGQALIAGLTTVPADRAAHSIHAHFLKAGSNPDLVDYRVETLRDGRSFSTRQVVATQHGRPLLHATISCHVPEAGLMHQDAMPEVPGPEGLRSEHDLREAALAEPGRAWIGPLSTRNLRMELRPVTPRDFARPQVMPPVQHFWLRPPDPVPDDPRLRQAMLAYFSDAMLLSTTLLPHGIYWSTTPIDNASLDHALWLHAAPTFDDWLLWTIETGWSGGARGLARGRFFSRDGRLLATVMQEGLIRVRAQSDGNDG